eukprot:786834_1
MSASCNANQLVAEIHGYLMQIIEGDPSTGKSTTLDVVSVLFDILGPQSILFLNEWNSSSLCSAQNNCNGVPFTIDDGDHTKNDNRRKVSNALCFKAFSAKTDLTLTHGARAGSTANLTALCNNVDNFIDRSDEAATSRYELYFWKDRVLKMDAETLHRSKIQLKLFKESLRFQVPKLLTKINYDLKWVEYTQKVMELLSFADAEVIRCKILPRVISFRTALLITMQNTVKVIPLDIEMVHNELSKQWQQAFENQLAFSHPDKLKSQETQKRARLLEEKRLAIKEKMDAKALVKQQQKDGCKKLVVLILPLIERNAEFVSKLNDEETELMRKWTDPSKDLLNLATNYKGLQQEVYFIQKELLQSYDLLNLLQRLAATDDKVFLVDLDRNKFGRLLKEENWLAFEPGRNTYRDSVIGATYVIKKNKVDEFKVMLESMDKVVHAVEQMDMNEDFEQESKESTLETPQTDTDDCLNEVMMIESESENKNKRKVTNVNNLHHPPSKKRKQ